jgi:hypothetical protein
MHTGEGIRVGGGELARQFFACFRTDSKDE